MGLVLRLVTGSALSYPQMDNNLIYLDNKVTGSTGYLTYFSGSSSTAAAVGQSLLFQTGSKMLMTGSFNVLGPISTNNVLQITPQHPLPAAASYPNSFAVSSSTPPVPYFSNGTSWTALY
jgi:hypothetical protein